MSDFLETPILDTVENYLSKDPIRLHVPFHSGLPNNPNLPKEIYNLDISEVDDFELEGKKNPIYKSEKITADYFEVDHSFYLTGGASSGILASLFALRKYGKKVILPRNVHKSVINGLVLSGLEPVWMEVDFLSEWGIYSKIDPVKLKKLLKENDNVAGVLIVSPTYEGVISDVNAISEICQEKNVPLIVDEAHGGSYKFLNEYKVKSSIQLGANLVIQSWHKSLGSLTQTGILHLVDNKYFSYKDIKRSLDLMASTSPSFPLLLSLEITRKKLAEHKAIFIKGIKENSDVFKDQLSKIEGLELFQTLDPLKVYLKTKTTTGNDFANRLYEDFGVEVESANDLGFLMLLGPNFNYAIRDKVLNAIKEVLKSSKSKGVTHAISPKLNSFVLSPREAFIRGYKEQLDVETEIIAPCPPGYALNIPGSKKEKQTT